MSSPIVVAVTEEDIRGSEAGDCFRCAVAKSLHRCTGDDHANVYERDWIMYLEVWSRHIVAPIEVREFVENFDAQPRQAGSKSPRLPALLPEEVGPFTFELPPQTDPEWQERCTDCEELFASAELDDEGYCPECHAEQVV